MTTTMPPMCLGCSRLEAASSTPACGAFPDGIPAAIWFQGADHRHPFVGDRGLQFQARTPAVAAAVNQFYDDLDRERAPLTKAADFGAPNWDPMGADGFGPAPVGTMDALAPCCRDGLTKGEHRDLSQDGRCCTDHPPSSDQGDPLAALTKAAQTQPAVQQAFLSSYQTAIAQQIAAARAQQPPPANLPALMQALSLGTAAASALSAGLAVLMSAAYLAALEALPETLLTGGMAFMGAAAWARMNQQAQHLALRVTGTYASDLMGVLPGIITMMQSRGLQGDELWSAILDEVARWLMARAGWKAALIVTTAEHWAENRARQDFVQVHVRQAALIWRTHYSADTCDWCKVLNGMAHESIASELLGMPGLKRAPELGDVPPLHPNCRCEWEVIPLTVEVANA